MTDEQLAAIRARREALPEEKYRTLLRSEWAAGYTALQPRIVWIDGPDLCRILNSTDNADMTRAIAEVKFIAHAYRDIPALLAEVERLRGLLSSGAAS